MKLDLRCVLLNVENLFILLDKPLPPHFDHLSEVEWQQHSTSVYPNKPLGKLLKLKTYFQELDADLILLTEVGGEESLRNFNDLFLGDNYRVALIEGNSDRSIDVGYLLHKRISTHFDLVSNKDRSIHFWYPHERAIPSHPSHKFSRDAVELHLFTRDLHKPYLIFILTHLKSPLDPEGIDPFGMARREAELNALIEIYHEIQQQHPQVPIIVCGDLNGNASRQSTDKEFLNLYSSTDLEDALALAQRTPEERVTFYPLKGGSLQTGRQIDYVLLSKQAQSFLIPNESFVFRYEIPPRGRPLGPVTTEERYGLPSDHYPLVFQLRQIPTDLP